MSKRIAVAVLAGVLTTGAVAAQTLTAEQAIESSTAALNLPDKLPGSISLAPCNEGCVPMLLQITAESRFFNGRTPLTLQELHALTRRPALNVAVFFEPRTRAVTRIVVSGRAQ
jgi:hypothetical protein